MAIEEQQPVAAAALKREQATEQDRAIATEKDGKLSVVSRASDRMGKVRRIVGNGLRIEEKRLPVTTHLRVMLSAT